MTIWLKFIKYLFSNLKRKIFRKPDFLDYMEGFKADQKKKSAMAYANLEHSKKQIAKCELWINSHASDSPVFCYNSKREWLEYIEHLKQQIKETETEIFLLDFNNDFSGLKKELKKNQIKVS